MAKKVHFRLWVLAMTVILLSGCISAGPDPEPTMSARATQTEAFFLGSTVREKDGMVQLALPGGIYIQGSTEEEVEGGLKLCQQHYSPCNSWYYEREFPDHEVELSPYLIDQNEVTNQLYKSCVDAGSCAEPLLCMKGEPTYLDPDKKDHPVVCVNWDEANSYCDWVGGRLPTEAEWEYAFRGDRSLVFPWGNEFQGTKLNFCDANCDLNHADETFDDGFQGSAPAGSYPPGASWSGVHNMAGNVSEWVSDWYAEYQPGKLINPAGPSAGDQKLIKGCSWYSPAAYCRGAARGSADPLTRFDYLGFRCAATPSPNIDGVIQPGEWDQADIYYFEDGSELYLLFSDNHLHLAIKSISGDMISANVFLASAEKIDILHTSAALGTAIYQPEGGTWRRTRDFEWCCRSKLDNAAARSARETFSDLENWLGINSFNGTANELEYKIVLTGAERSLAVNFLRVNNIDDKQVWPVGTKDGPAQPTVGGFPERLDFSPGEWFAIEVLK